MFSFFLYEAHITDADLIFDRYNWHTLTKNGNCGMHGLYANTTSRRFLPRERLYYNLALSIFYLEC